MSVLNLLYVVLVLVLPPNSVDCHEQVNQSCEQSNDVVIVLDSTESIGPMKFQRMKSHAKTIVEKLDLFNCDKVALMTFAKFVRVPLFFTFQHKVPARVSTIIDELRGPLKLRPNEVPDSNSVLRLALHFANDIVFEIGSRKSAKMFLVLLTDGHQPQSTAMDQNERFAFQQLRENGVHVVVLSMQGKPSSVERLDNIYGKENVFAENHVDDLISAILPNKKVKELDVDDKE